MKNRKLGNKYEIQERLGRGGMAEVYRAYHASLDRYVAIKVLHSFLSDDPEFKTRFEKEAQNIAKLRHPHIVQVYDFEYDPETESYYMVMELIEGPTLRDRLVESADQDVFLPLNEALRITREAAMALSYAHARGMIHRDVKPANLMIDTHEKDRMVLTDFGIAKLMTGAQFTVSGGMVGTPAYMAPEQGMGETGDERSDLYSLGVIFYQMLTNELPYEADTPLAIILRHMNDPIPSVRKVVSHLPPAVDKVLQKMLAKEPSERYQTAQEVIEDLEVLEKTPAKLDPQTLILPKDTAKEVEKQLAAKKQETSKESNGNRSRVGCLMLTLLLSLIIILGGGYIFGVANGSFAPLPFLVQFFPTPTTAATDTPEPTATFTVEPTATWTDTPAFTDTPDATSTFTPTPTATNTLTNTPTSTNTSTPINSETPTATLTPTQTSTSQEPTPNATQTYSAQRTATTTACTFDYAVISQEKPNESRDGYHEAGEDFIVNLKLLNTGTCAWEPNTSLTFIEGENFNAGARVFIPVAVEPGFEYQMEFVGEVPTRVTSVNVIGRWQLRTPGQLPIGIPLEITAKVFDPG